MFQLLELIENEEDREFCRKLSEQFDSAMYHVAYGILKNSADAEDAVQESYIAIIIIWIKFLVKTVIKRGTILLL